MGEQVLTPVLYLAQAEGRLAPNSFVLIIGTSPSLNYFVISNVVKSLDLFGIQVFYSNKN